MGNRPRAIDRACRSASPLPEGDVELSVIDDGVGITDETLEREPGLGLRTMAYRAHRVGGALEVRPGKAGGTEVRVVFRPHAPDAGDGSGAGGDA